jgi:hypothetical protein
MGLLGLDQLARDLRASRIPVMLAPVRYIAIALDCTKGNITMAGVFGKDPNMKKNIPAELERVNLERKRKLAEAASKFTQKKPVVPSAEPGSK